MMKRSVSLLIVCILATAASLAAQDIRYATSSVRMRAEASTSSRVLTTVPRGAASQCVCVL